MKNNLERLIKQNVPFISPLAKAEVGFLYLSYLNTCQSNQYFKKYGITSQQYNVLRILRGQFPRPANINLIRERMLDKMSDASRIVDRLLKNGLVTKQPNSIDKRNADVMITEKAMDMLEEISKTFDQRETILNGLDKKDIEHFNELIDRILDNI
jgi:DNA-binding MarR family transcriptional regulator